jgi:hypothetical protein
LIVVIKPIPAVPRGFLIVVRRQMPAAPLIERCSYLIVVSRLMPAAPPRYLIAVLRPMPAAPRRCPGRIVCLYKSKFREFYTFFDVRIADPISKD